jgi:hypothetical protein
MQIVKIYTVHLTVALGKRHYKLYANINVQQITRKENVATAKEENDTL